MTDTTVTVPGIEADDQAEPFQPIEAAVRIAAGYRDGPIVLHGSGIAYYKPTLDVVCLPEPKRFDPSESY